MTEKIGQAKLAIGVVVLQKTKGAEKSRGVAGVKAGEAAVHQMIPMIEIDDTRGREEMIRKPRGERAAAEGILQSTGSTKERILPVDHIEALTTKDARERREHTKIEEKMYLYVDSL